MSLRPALLLLALFSIGGSGSFAAAEPAPSGFEYVSPVPGSRLVSRFNNVILRPGPPLVPAALRSFRMSVVGTVSGTHPGRLSLSDDSRTLVFEPESPFQPGEIVTVTVGHDFEPGPEGGAEDPALESRGAGGTPRVAPDRSPRHLEFWFEVSPLDAPLPSANLLQPATDEAGDDPETKSRPASPESNSNRPPATANALPAGFPTIRLLASDRPAEGYRFVAPFSQGSGTSGHLVIFDREGMPVFYRRTYRASFDFKPLPGGRATYFTGQLPGDGVPRYYVIDDRGNEVERIAAGNGYLTDTHELKLLPDGHVLLMIYDTQPVRMDTVVSGGRPDARVIGLVIQELDLERRVVFQWRSWDHFEITDAASPLVDLTTARIDYVHGNAIAADLDGNLLVCSRHLNEITKISRRTGEVIWRMGSHAVRNDFTFENDDRGFSHPHDVRRLPNGNLTLFDNGNGLVPPYSRALEYELDEPNRVARLVWEYRHPTDLYAAFMGSFERFEDGSALVGWGGFSGDPKLTELHPDGSTALEIGFPAANQWTYRAFRGPWRTSRLEVEPAVLEFDAADGVSGAERVLTVTNPGPDPLELNYFASAGSPAFSIPDPAPRTLAAGERVDILIRLAPGSSGPLGGRAYLGTVGVADLVARDVELRLAPALGRVLAPLTLRPNAREFDLAEVRTGAPIRFRLPAPGRSTLELFDVRGARIATLDAGERAAGEHAVEWASDRLPNGIYFVRLAGDPGVRLRRVAVLH